MLLPTTGTTGHDSQLSHEITCRAVGDFVTVGIISGLLVLFDIMDGCNGISVGVACVPQATRKNPRILDVRKRKYFTGIMHLIPLTAYPAIAGGAAKDQLRGRREF
jgi:hypothetical protein